MKSIYFDMDGTIANLYAVLNWLPMLRAEDTTPYTLAKPLIKMNILARLLNALKKDGWTIGVVSWTAKNGTEEYNERVAKAKIEQIEGNRYKTGVIDNSENNNNETGYSYSYIYFFEGEVPVAGDKNSRGYRGGGGCVTGCLLQVVGKEI